MFSHFPKYPPPLPLPLCRDTQYSAIGSKTIESIDCHKKNQTLVKQPLSFSYRNTHKGYVKHAILVCNLLIYCQVIKNLRREAAIVATIRIL